MANPEAAGLTEKATKLRKFADEVDKLANTVHETAGAMQWSGPLTDRTRREIWTWRTRCGDAAAQLREEADRLMRESTMAG